MIRARFNRLHPLLRVAVVCFAVAALLILLALVALPVTEAAPAADRVADRVAPGTRVTITGPAQNVACGLGCCCGYVQGVYRGETYGGAYCRWFRPLRDGQTVTLTGRADANGYVR